MEVFELLGLFLTVLELNDGLNVLGVLRLFDLLLEFPVELRQLYLLEVLLPDPQFLLSVLLCDALSYFFAFLRPKVRLGVEILAVSLFYLLSLLSVFNLHFDKLLILQILQLSHLLLDFECLLLGCNLILELLLLDLLLQSKVFQLILHALFCVRFGHLVVLIELLSLCLMVIVDGVRAL